MSTQFSPSSPPEAGKSAKFMDPNNLTKKEITMQNVKTRKMKIKPCESRIVFVTCRRIGAGKSS